EPCLKRGEAGAVLARLHLGNERCFLTAEGVDIEVVAAAAETARAAERVTLGMNTEGAVTLDKLALDPVAFPAVTNAAHDPPLLQSTSALGRTRLISVSMPPLLIAGCQSRPPQTSVAMTCAGPNMRVRLALRAVLRAAKWALLA